MIKANNNIGRCDLSPYGRPRRIFLSEPRGVYLAESIFYAIYDIVDEYPCVEVISPEFEDPTIKDIKSRILGNRQIVCECKKGTALVEKIRECYFVVSDDIKICRVAFEMQKPTLITLCDLNVPLPPSARLVGNMRGPIYRGMSDLLGNPALYYAMESVGKTVNMSYIP